MQTKEAAISFRRFVSGNMYQIKYNNDSLVHDKEIKIKIIAANPGNFMCTIDPDYKLDVGPNGSWTPMDIDLHEFGLDPGKHVKVTIDIVDDWVRFIPNDEKGRHCITVGTPEAVEDFWNLRQYNEDSSRFGYFKSVSFLCRMSEKQLNIHPYNVGVVFLKSGESNYEFPVILDPKVRNDGG